MTLAGGGALLQGFADRMGEECQMPARLAESPLTCVATGSGQALEEFEAIKRALKNSSRVRYDATERRLRGRRRPCTS